MSDALDGFDRFLADGEDVRDWSSASLSSIVRLPFRGVPGVEADPEAEGFLGDDDPPAAVPVILSIRRLHRLE